MDEIVWRISNVFFAFLGVSTPWNSVVLRILKAARAKNTIKSKINQIKKFILINLIWNYKLLFHDCDSRIENNLWLAFGKGYWEYVFGEIQR